ncbi:MAG TPA: ArsA-related P-loop ATPase, partial [Acidimicrobiales bacterium]|nr:ArsA-related P-loop ATPase [Acidimicrobiales bacterium]
MDEDGLTDARDGEASSPAATTQPGTTQPATTPGPSSAAAPKKAATRKAATKAASTKSAEAKKASPTRATPAKKAAAKSSPTAKASVAPRVGPDPRREGGPSGGEAKSGSIDGLLAAKEIVIACGPGGVGKTTTAAAAGVMAAVQQGGKVLVLTVDPAKRLANALGLEGIGNAERRVPDEAFRAAGLKPRGELWAAMLDTKESWDALIRRHAPDTQTRDEILANPLYQNISGRFVQSH